MAVRARTGPRTHYRMGHAMMEPYILIVIASVRGDLNIQYMELMGQATCANARRIIEQTRTDYMNVTTVCFPKQLSVKLEK